VGTARKGLTIGSHKLGAPLAAALAAIPSIAHSKPIDVPAGTVGQAAFAIGRQAGVSIAIPDPAVLNRRAPAIRGQADANHALMRLASTSGLQLRKIGANSYLLAALPRGAVRRSARPLPATPAVSHFRKTSERDGQDIVVVASKRDTLSRRFSGAWSRIDGDELSSLGVRGAETIEARTVGFSSTHLGSGRNKLFIRGIADSSFSGPTQSPVGQYFDDVRTGYSGADPDLKLVDMQSVEILEGPQSTLYGSGALGGIVLLRPNKPVFRERSGMIATGASLTGHGDPGHDASAMVNLPLGSTLAIRGVAYHAREGGYIDNLATAKKDVNDVRVTGARATLSVMLGSDWLFDVGGAAQRISGDDSQYADRDGGRLVRASLVEQPFISSFRLASMVVHKDEGAIRFRSTSAVTRQDIDESFDATALNEPRQLRQHSQARSISNETRLWRPMDEGYSWLAGLSVISHRYGVYRDLRQETGSTDLAGAVNRVREMTVFGEVGFELGRNVEGTVGARYTIAALSAAGQHLSPAAIFPAGAKRTERSFLPSASLLVRPTERLAVYARYQQGFRPGGVSIAGDTVSLYSSDRLRTAELGIRFGQRGRDRFDVQASATHNKWSNIQADFLDPSGLPITDNIGDGRVWTLTANGGAQVTDALRLEAGVAWNKGRVTNPDAEYRLAWDELSGSMDIPNIARVVARGAIDWRTQLGSNWALSANLYARYVGKSRLGVGPRLADQQGEYLDSGLNLRLANDRLAWTLNVTNITNEVGNRFAFGAPMGAIDQITPLRPRTVRLGFERRF